MPLEMKLHKVSHLKAIICDYETTGRQGNGRTFKEQYNLLKSTNFKNEPKNILTKKCLVETSEVSKSWGIPNVDKYLDDAHKTPALSQSVFIVRVPSCR